MLLLIVGAVLNLAVSVAAALRRSLTRSAAIIGALLGFGILFSGGFFAWLLLMSFYLSSTLLSRFRKGDKGVMERLTGKSGPRDFYQVLANGAAALLAAICYRFTASAAYIVAYAAVLAAANADTWASELGVLSRGKPVSIVTGRRVMRGASGGVSALGFAASLGGSLLIAGIFTLSHLAVLGRTEALVLGAFVLVCGYFGSVLDSVLGASVQAQFVCSETGDYTESRLSGDSVNRLVRGLRFFSNDMVNLVSTTSAGILCGLLALLTAS